MRVVEQISEISASLIQKFEKTLVRLCSLEEPNTAIMNYCTYLLKIVSIEVTSRGIGR